MESKKVRVIKLVIHYILFAILVAGTVVSYLYRAKTAEYFAENLTNSEIMNLILHQVPAIIKSIQIIMLAVVANGVVKLFTKLGLGLTDKGKTIINIINSLIKWIIIISAILWILSIWGVDTTTLLASAGILALIIGLGAQSLIADILAGIFIVLEGEYVVGDIVVIDGWRGKIISIGIRTTQLQDAGGNIKIVNNSEIKSVINQTKLQSVASCTLNVAANESLTKVEELIKEALPQIKAEIPAITGYITYKGVTNITDSTMELLFNANCHEEDLYQVQRDLKRQLKLLLESNGISSFANATYNIVEEKKK